MSKRKYLKPKKCKVCGVMYGPRSTTQKVCSPGCAIELNRLNKVKQWDKETRDKKKAIKRKSEYEAETQAACNEYIRTRDNSDRCISCGRDHSGQYHAGHYRSVGSCPELRFNTLNIHKQCSSCNNFLSGNPIPYRQRLIKKIGLEMVEWLEGPHELNHYSINDLVRLKKIFKRKTKWLKNRQSANLRL